MTSLPSNDEEDPLTARGGKRSWGDVEDRERQVERHHAIRRARSQEEPDSEPCTKMARLPVSPNRSSPSLSLSWPCVESGSVAASMSAGATVEPSVEEAVQTLMRDALSDASGTIESIECELPYAPSLAEYCASGGTSRFLPRPEWIAPLRKRNPRSNKPGDYTADQETHTEEPPPPPPLPPPVAAQDNRNAAPNDGLLPDHLFGAWASPRRREAGNSRSSSTEDADAVGDESSTNAASSAGPIASNGTTATAPEQMEETTEAPLTRATFGKDHDTALHVAIREGYTEAALELIVRGTLVHAENGKGVTPLILASQKGNLKVVQALLDLKASPLAASITGCTALLQASHFGHGEVVNLLLQHGARIELANYKNTTALMRASQEGHTHVVETLLRHGAQANRRNNEQMSALMLASQRGHADVAKQLVDANAELNVMTPQDSTALMLACKRGHMGVVKVLVTSGCELQLRDARGRTARDMAQRKHHKQLLELLTHTKQIDLMRRESRRERNYAMIQMWQLLSTERALVEIPFEDMTMTIHQLCDHPKRPQVLSCMRKSVSALVQAMMLPAPLLEHIAAFMPLPRLWDRRISLITKRCGIDADSSVSCTMDLIDEILEDGGFVEACDLAGVTPPTNFTNWRDWKYWGKQFDGANIIVSTADSTVARPPSATNSTLPFLLMGATSPSSSSSSSSCQSSRRNNNTNPQQGETNANSNDPSSQLSSIQMRREVCFLQLLAHRSPLLARTLASPPYNMPPMLLQQLKNVSDIQSVVRRMGSKGVHFDASVAIELVMLAGTLSSWYHRERSEL